MRRRLESIPYPALAATALFAVTLFYNGPGHSLHWLSVSGTVLLVWLATGIARFDTASPVFRIEWLPTVAVTYFGWLLAAPWLSTYPYASWSAAMQLSLLPLTLLAWLLIPKTHEEVVWRVAWRGLLCGATVIAAWGIYHYLVAKTRAHGPLVDANAYAALINFFLISCLVGFLIQPKQLRSRDAALVSVISMLALAQAMSLSRGGLLAFIAVLPLVIWHCRSAMSNSRALTAALILIGAHLSVELFPIDTARPIIQSPDELLENDSSLHARFKIWQSTWAIISDSNLIVGTGLGTFKTYYAIYRDPSETQSSGNLAHNDYLQALQEGGLIQLAFFLVLTAVAPIYLLRTLSARKQLTSTLPATGLLIAVLCLSIHGLVNFIQFVAPIAVLTGISLAQGWQRTAGPSSPDAVLKLTRISSPRTYKAVAIAAVSVPICALAVDGVIFATIAADKIPSAQIISTTTLNIATTLRPSNPIPRALLIQRLLDAANKTNDAATRKRFLDFAEMEANSLVTYAPALASGPYFRGIARAMRGTNDDLALARTDLEDAVRRVPPATSMRLELIRLYERMGKNEDAYQAILEAKKWVYLERDHLSLAAFAYQASSIAAQRDPTEAEYWSWIYGRITELGLTG